MPFLIPLISSVVSSAHNRIASRLLNALPTKPHRSVVPSFLNCQSPSMAASKESLRKVLAEKLSAVEAHGNVLGFRKRKQLSHIPILLDKI
ncbi:hypothetical protein V6N13_068386 [Hibiscus sabdariffa]|uniref:Uncharacterized protein n=1 Tax=Hibiscus sabdariffa TaxID=183260 RepID=A0ABR2QMG5_9ROSI